MPSISPALGTSLRFRPIVHGRKYLAFLFRCNGWFVFVIQKREGDRGPQVVVLASLLPEILEVKESDR